MRFDCNCKTDEDLREMIKEIHEDDGEIGWNWDVGARLWLSDMDETIMVEYQIMSARGKRNFDSPDESDWFTAYLVDNENDDRPDREVDTIDVGNFNTLQELKDAMDKYANDLFQ